MARAQGKPQAITTSQARTVLPKLARTAARRSKAAKNIRDHAVAIHPRGEERSAYLVPEVDIEAAERRIEELEEELEDVALMRLMEQRVLSDGGNLTHVDDVIREFGFEELLSE